MSLTATTGLGKLFLDDGKDDAWAFKTTLAYFVYNYYFFPNKRSRTLRNAKEKVLKSSIKVFENDKIAQKTVYKELASRIKRNNLRIDKMPFLIKEFLLFGRLIKSFGKYLFYLIVRKAV